MWIQLITIANIDVQGKRRTFHPGDWVDLGKHDALLLIQNGNATIPGPQLSDAFSRNTGLVLWGGASAALLAENHDTLQVSQLTCPDVIYERSCLIGQGYTPRMAWLAAGVQFLDVWDIAIPLFDYNLLALNIGEDEEREATRAIIRDLRVPVYDVRLMFAKQTECTSELLHEWNEIPGNRMLAFMQALYRVKPLVLALPTSWTG